MVLAYRGKIENPENVCEVLDNKGKPLCIMKRSIILAQKLPHVMVGALLRHGGKWILRRDEEERFGFCVQGMLPAFTSPEDYCQKMLSFYKIQNLVPVLAGVYPPCEENRNSLAKIYSAEVNAAFPFADPDFLTIDNSELYALGSRGYLAPFITLLAESGWFCNHTRDS